MSGTEEIFTTAESEARLDLIRHLIENSELVPLVRGVSGIGKSLLASRLQAGAPENWVVCHFEADSMLQPERLLSHIARCNGLPDAQDDNLRRLVDRFETLRKRGKVPVLLIDDAQKLPPTSLITLLRLYERQVDGAPLVSLVLFADEQIDMLLSTPQLQVMSPQSIQVIDLPPLTRDEADAFMRHLLQLEGLEQNLMLDSARLTRLYRDTGGAPGPLASAILGAVGGAEGAPAPDARGIIGNPLLWSALSLVVLLLLLAIYREPVRRFILPQPKPALVTSTQSGKQIESSERGGPVSRPESERQVAETAEERPPSEQPKAQAGPAADSEGEEQVADGMEGQVTQVVAEAPEVGVAEPVQAASDEARSVARPETASAAPETTPSPAADGEPPVPLEEKPAVAAESGVEKAVEEPVTVSAEPQPAPQPPASPPPSTTLLKSPAWLAEQAPGGFTIQLLAAERIESVHEAAAAYQLRDRAFTVRTERQGRAWYPLLWGRFADRQAATDALNRLPPKLRQGGAWVRSFASLRQ